jgi:hypothetical protein
LAVMEMTFNISYLTTEAAPDSALWGKQYG